MSYKVEGTITAISEKQMFDAGSGKLTFKVNTGDEYNDDLEFELYKGAKYVEHLDNFTKYNNIGDNVEVEFNLKSKSWTNPKTNEERTFTSLSCWKVEKSEGSTPAQSQPSPRPTVEDTTEDLPF